MKEIAAFPSFSRRDSEAVPWQRSAVAPGVEVKNLGTADGRAIQLVKFAPGVTFPDHFHTGPEFIYMLEGEAVQNGEVLSAGWVGIASAGTIDHGFRSETGCVFLFIYDHGQVFDSVQPPVKE
ncbi:MULTISPECIES: cupin domain-containing protein [Paraburkholderia]|jgi:anti-sigma factor ChrR (cupin superfamily)|uniref:Putative transcriptional regulator n=1 Tax=Paraburkholderia aspalathi TaxID=1324617 RepID=A0A1I7CPH6_9BURK|nr:MULTISPECIES: cupin domain-containing protein [Paraburkholderia]MCP2088453.1 anti-sigma factor ChrR (cupin superfamily) [Paraburkholderia sediminicola]MBK3822732.1 cupin domain-containing protein [Paraburkholderia aspalathi]MBK3834565.1 cupin domain-containing protein [Paraburkholderia aspalathi]MBK3840463.1 cupin domain-containing protein [Paraburkholderia aspalathi]MBK3864321.1 cupin domain-containing protein [Paraburkholderia aspalathi]